MTQESYNGRLSATEIDEQHNPRHGTDTLKDLITERTASKIKEHYIIIEL